MARTSVCLREEDSPDVWIPQTITHYELRITITRTSVRLYEGKSPRCVDYPTIMHYAL